MELSDAVIDVIRDRDDYTTLRSCARISKQWLPRSRSHLWNTIFIDNPRQLDSLRNILEETPEIRELVFSVVTNTQAYHVRNWVLHDEAPPVIFPFLPKLQRWQIHHLDWAVDSVDLEVDSTESEVESIDSEVDSVDSEDDFGVPLSLTPTSLASLDRHTAIRELSIEPKYFVFPDPKNIFLILATLKSLEVLRIVSTATDLSDKMISSALRADFKSASRLIELYVSSLMTEYSVLLLTSGMLGLRFGSTFGDSDTRIQC